MNQGIEEGRNTIRGLRSSDTRTLDLVLALSIQQELAVQPDTDFLVIVAGRPQPLRPPIRQEIYRIGREACSTRFAIRELTKRVEFELEYADSDLRMQVRDNGCGIDPQVLHAGREGHWGLGRHAGAGNENRRDTQNLKQCNRGDRNPTVHSKRASIRTVGS